VTKQVLAGLKQSQALRTASNITLMQSKKRITKMRVKATNLNAKPDLVREEIKRPNKPPPLRLSSPNKRKSPINSLRKKLAQPNKKSYNKSRSNSRLLR
jgi:hypothetical protein